MLDSGQFLESQFRGENCIFNLLKPEEMAILENNHQVSRYKKNEYVYREGEIPVGMQYLKEGMVKLIKEGIGGRDQIIRMIPKNGLIGYRSLIAGEPHNGD